MRTRARYDEAADEWVLSGQKAYATNGGIAGVHVVTAVVDPDLGSRGQAAFVVPPGTKGLEGAKKLRKLGLRASHTADVFLDDVRVPGACLLGGKDKLDERLARAREGKKATGQAAMRTFELTRPAVGAQAIGVARAAYEYALDYAKRPRAVRQADHREPGRRVRARRHADGDRRARLLVWRAAWMGRNERQFEAGEGSMSKLKAGEVAVAVTGAGRAVARRRRLPARAPGGAVVPRRQDLHHLRGNSEIQRLVVARAISGVYIR
jgi:acyl-CoA dehydrogenase